MKLANEVRKYAYTCLTCIERSPKMWGNDFAVETQYLMALEFLAISFGLSPSDVRDRYKGLLESMPGPSNVPLSSRDMTVENIVDVMKPIRLVIETEGNKATSSSYT